MLADDLIALLKTLPPETEVFVECPETCRSWSIEGVSQAVVKNKKEAIITIGELNGPHLADTIF